MNETSRRQNIRGNSIGIAIALLCVSLFGACKGTSTSPLGLSTFAGRIALFDSIGQTIKDFSGVTVQLDNTSFQTTTKTDGSWEIGDVPAGQYDVSATKAGYGTFYWFEQSVIGGRYDLPTAALAQMPNLAPSANPSMGSDLLELGESGNAGSKHDVASYVDLDSNVEPSAPHFLVAAEPGASYISINDLRTAGAQPGQALYVSRAWVFASEVGPDIGQYEYSFYDPRHHETRYASNGPKSKVFEVTMPQ